MDLFLFLDDGPMRTLGTMKVNRGQGNKSNDVPANTDPQRPEAGWGGTSRSRSPGPPFTLPHRRTSPNFFSKWRSGRSCCATPRSATRCKQGPQAHACKAACAPVASGSGNGNGNGHRGNEQRRKGLGNLVILLWLNTKLQLILRGVCLELEVF